MREAAIIFVLAGPLRYSDAGHGQVVDADGRVLWSARFDEALKMFIDNLQHSAETAARAEAPLELRAVHPAPPDSPAR